MIYTQQRRRAMNKVVRSLYPDIEFYESPDGVPVMECEKLPERAVHILSPNEFIQKLDRHCLQKNDIGLMKTDIHKVLPVFIRSTELNGRLERHYFRVNYVSSSQASMQRAIGYIEEGKLYAVL